MNATDSSPIIFYYYKNLSDPAFFWRLLEKRFRESGHDRPIEFRCWDCYHELPGKDGDIYCYDGMVMSALAYNGYIRRLPAIIDVSGVFQWILDGSMYRRTICGIPFLICGNVLISRKGDGGPVRSVYDIKGGLAAPMKSMVFEYFLFAYFNMQSGSEEAVDAMKALGTILGGREKYDNTEFAVYDGIDRFLRGECRYILGFTEDLRRLPAGDYLVQYANFSHGPHCEIPFFYTDYISIGRSPSGEKLLDCLDIAEIVSDSRFAYELCTGGGKLQYMLPADRTLYPLLSAADPVYDQLFALARSENNCVLRYGRDFYTEFQRKADELLAALE